MPESANKSMATDPLEVVIARLRAMGEKETAEATADGRAAGDVWARREASPAALRRLAVVVQSTPGGAKEFVTADSFRGAQRSADRIAATITGSHATDADLFWETVLGDDDSHRVENPDFATAFVEAAVEVWVAVEPHL